MSSGRMALGGTSLRDRTTDFAAIAARLQKQAGLPSSAADSASSSGLSATHAAAKQAVQQQSEFARKASQIGLSIHKTSAKLQKLAALAKRSSMFDDPSQEIDEMTGIIKQDIQGLNMAIADLQRVSGRAGGDTANKQSADHSHTVVDNLRSRLKDATQEFKDVLTLRTENLKVHNERRQLFAAQPDAAAGLLEAAPLLGGSGGFGHHSSSSSAAAANGFGSGGSSSRPTAAGLFGNQQQHGGGGGGGGMQMQQQFAPQESQYSSSRAEALHNVETTIVELGTIFTQLAEMVAAQGEMTQRIDENVDETLANVDQAKAQLMRYLTSISSNRWLLAKAFGVLMVFLVIFIAFIA